MYAYTGSLARLSEIISKYNHSKSQSLYLSNSGGVRISPSQSASNVKIRPRHMTTRWEGQGPSLSVSRQNTHVSQQRHVSFECGLGVVSRVRD